MSLVPSGHNIYREAGAPPPLPGRWGDKRMDINKWEGGRKRWVYVITLGKKYWKVAEKPSE